ncbi:MAG TPA: universal stress protein [Anaerolineales bacterium]|nr:universal stress protein [Anaerolineales bacterium]
MSDLRDLPGQDILLAVDGSEHSLAAAQLLCDLSMSAPHEIIAVAVLLPRDAANHAALETALEQTRDLLQGKGINVETELLVGSPATMLTEYAEAHSPDLIVLGAKGLRATLGILLGGVVQQVVEYGTWPVLVVRAPYRGLHRIALVTDGSVYSQMALEYLDIFPLPASASIQVLHVLPPLPVPVHIMHSWPVGAEAVTSLASYESDKLLSKQMEDEEQAGKTLLADALITLKERGIEASSVLLRGDAATEIIEYVKSHQIDLLVAGSRGLSQMKRLMLGSLSRKLVHYAGCSVLIVKGGLDDTHG